MLLETSFMLLLVLAALVFTVWLFILLPAGMARTRGRSAVGWVLVSLLISPLLACLLLLLIGDNPDRAG